MDFTIDDMIEFFESELKYCEKEKDRIHKENFNNGMVKDKYSFFLGNYVGLSTAHQSILGQLVELKKNQNKKIKELIDWCQEETDSRIKIEEDGYSTSRFKDMASSQKIILDAVKDKLCSIYEDDEHERN